MTATANQYTDFVRRGDIALPDSFVLSHHQQASIALHLAYNIYGDLNKPCILLLGGISSGKDAGHQSAQYASGWFEQHIGYGKTLDLNHYSILTIDYLAGHGDSTSSLNNKEILVITPDDQARAIIELTNSLGLKSLQLAIGYSYGGQVLLNVGAIQPDLIVHSLVCSAAHQPSPKATALRSLQRQLLKRTEIPEQERVSLARQLAHLFYRGEGEFDERFSSDVILNNEESSSEVESYLTHQGRKFAENFSARAFYQLSLSTDLQQINSGELQQSITFLAIEEDQLVPVALIESLAEATDSALIKLSSNVGHDAFLVEHNKMTWVMRRLLAQ